VDFLYIKYSILTCLIYLNDFRFTLSLLSHCMFSLIYLNEFFFSLSPFSHCMFSLVFLCLQWVIFLLRGALLWVNACYDDLLLWHNWAKFYTWCCDCKLHNYAHIHWFDLRGLDLNFQLNYLNEYANYFT
jgi:hypothetical protein